MKGSINMDEIKGKINITSPSISEETLKEMAMFFKKTSIPRILAEELKTKNKMTNSN